MSYIDRTEHISKFGGNIWYVSKTGNDANSGRWPDDAFLTIGAAIIAAAAGDAINVKAGAYDENGLNLDHDAMELWTEIGVTISNTNPGTCLTLSGASCKITGHLKMTVSAAQTGLVITGNECFVAGVKILTGAIGVLITGQGVILNDCAVGFPTTTAYDLQGIQGRLYKCKTVGNAATTGYKINNNVDTGVLEDCTSSGHQTCGFCIETGSQDWTLLNCSSGGGDGRWTDADHANVWSNFSYADVIHKVTTFGGAPTTYNIYKLTGAVRISEIFGTVETVIPNTASTIHLEIYSTNASVDITDAPGVNIANAVAGAILVRNGPSTDELDLADPDSTPAVAENTNWRDPKTAVDIVKDDAADTYVRLVLSAALASGAIDWHCKWEPLSDNGILQKV